MAELLRQVLAWFDAPSVSISRGLLDDIGPDAIGTLVQLKLIEPAAPATRLTCPECDTGHVETVAELIEEGTRFSFITCPEVGMVRIDPTALERWAFSHDRFAALVASELGGTSTSLLDGRVWRVGAHEANGKRRDVLIARGLRWPEHAGCVARIRRSMGAVILVPCEPPPIGSWGGKPPRVVELERALGQSADGISLDLLLLKSLVDEADEAARLISVQVDETTLAKVADRAVAKRVPRRTNEETKLEVVARTATLDEAVARLKAQAIKTSRSALDRLVQKHGGIGAVRGPRSTRSFDLPVPSQDWDENSEFDEDDK